MEREWRTVEGFPYEVSNDGLLRRTTGGFRTHSGRMIAGRPSGIGYTRVDLHKRDGKRVATYMHRLVAAAFIRPPRHGEVVHHKDGNNRNNHVNNLAYTSVLSHAREQRSAVRHPRKLSPVDVQEIRRLLAEGMYIYQVAKLYGVSEKCIRGIRSGLTYRSVKDRPLPTQGVLEL